MVQQLALSKEQVVSQPQPTWVDQIIPVVLLLIVLAVVVVAIIIFVRWWFDKKEKNKDIYRKDYRETLEQCKISKNNKWLRSMFGMPLWLLSKGVPVILNYPPLHYSKQYGEEKSDVLVKIKEGMLLTVGESYVLGSYAGHCITKDGCFNLLVKSARDKVFFIFPKLLVVKLRLKHKQKIIDGDDAKRKATKELLVPPDSFSLSSDMIIINALGLERTGEYFYVVNMDESGYVVDTKPYIYNDLIEISTQKQVMDLGRNMAIIAEDWVRGNPLIQFLRKTDMGLTGD